jgi:hypothetical protein
MTGGYEQDNAHFLPAGGGEGGISGILLALDPKQDSTNICITRYYHGL